MAFVTCSKAAREKGREVEEASLGTTKLALNVARVPELSRMAETETNQSLSLPLSVYDLLSHFSQLI